MIKVISITKFLNGTIGGALGTFSTSDPAELTHESRLYPMRVTALIPTSIKSHCTSFQDLLVSYKVSNIIAH